MEKLVKFKQDEYETLHLQVNKLKEAGYAIELQDSIEKIKNEINKIKKINKSLQLEENALAKALNNLETSEELPQNLIHSNEKEKELKLLNIKINKVKKINTENDQIRAEMTKNLEELNNKLKKLKIIAENYNIPLTPNILKLKNEDLLKRIQLMEENLKSSQRSNAIYLDTQYTKSIEDIQVATEKSNIYLDQLNHIIDNQAQIIKDLLGLQNGKTETAKYRMNVVKLLVEEGKLDRFSVKSGDDTIIQKRKGKSHLKENHLRASDPEIIKDLHNELYMDLPIVNPQKDFKKANNGIKIRNSTKIDPPHDTNPDMIDMYDKHDKHDKHDNPKTEKHDQNNDYGQKYKKENPIIIIDKNKNKNYETKEESKLEAALGENKEDNGIPKPFTKPFGKPIKRQRDLGELSSENHQNSSSTANLKNIFTSNASTDLNKNDPKSNFKGSILESQDLKESIILQQSKFIGNDNKKSQLVLPDNVNKNPYDKNFPNNLSNIPIKNTNAIKNINEPALIISKPDTNIREIPEKPVHIKDKMEKLSDNKDKIEDTPIESLLINNNLSRVNNGRRPRNDGQEELKVSFKENKIENKSSDLTLPLTSNANSLRESKPLKIADSLNKSPESEYGQAKKGITLNNELKLPDSHIKTPNIGNKSSLILNNGGVTSENQDNDNSKRKPIDPFSKFDSLNIDDIVKKEKKIAFNNKLNEDDNKLSESNISKRDVPRDRNHLFQSKNDENSLFSPNSNNNNSNKATNPLDNENTNKVETGNLRGGPIQISNKSTNIFSSQITNNNNAVSHGPSKKKSIWDQADEGPIKGIKSLNDEDNNEIKTIGMKNSKNDDDIFEFNPNKNGKSNLKLPDASKDQSEIAINNGSTKFDEKSIKTFKMKKPNEEDTKKKVPILYYYQCCKFTPFPQGNLWVNQCSYWESGLTLQP